MEPLERCKMRHRFVTTMLDVTDAGHVLWHLEMSTSAEDYDKLSPEERKALDIENKAREAAEQASMIDASSPPENELTRLAALPYTWTQELGEVDVVVPVAKGTRGKDLNVVIQKKKLSVGLKGQEKILDGELCKEIKVEDSTWTIGEWEFHILLFFVESNGPLEDNQSVIIHLEKLNQQQWWENVLTHHPKIDTTKIEPGNSKLSDLDGETRFALLISIGAIY